MFVMAKEHGDSGDPPPTLARRVLGFSRAAFGAGLIVAPGPLATMWFGVDPGPIGRAAMRGLGGRDLVIGLGIGLAPASEAGRWLQYSMIADVADAVAVVGARRHVPSRNVLTVGLGALGYAAAALALDRAAG